MRSTILLLCALAAGLGASYALADRGHGDNHATSTTSSCQHTHVHGTVAAPQTLTVTVSQAAKNGPFAPGQVVTVSLGSAGQTVQVNLEGCAAGSTLTANQAELHVQGNHGGGDHQGGDQGDQQTTSTTTETTTTTPTTGTTTTTSTP